MQPVPDWHSYSLSGKRWVLTTGRTCRAVFMKCSQESCPVRDNATIALGAENFNSIAFSIALLRPK